MSYRDEIIADLQERGYNEEQIKNVFDPIDTFALHIQEKLHYEKKILELIMEECMEIGIEASKCKRFGMYKNYDGKTNVNRLKQEISDLLLLLDKLEIDYNSDEINSMKRDKDLKMKSEGVFNE